MSEDASSRAAPRDPNARGDDRARALARLRRYGRDATSFQLLESDYAYFFAGEGFVAYVDTGSAWVAGGGPVGPAAEIAAIARAFVGAAERAKRRASFFAVDESFARATGFPRVRIGAQPFWRPERWDAVLAASASLRYQVKRARKKGVAVRTVAAKELARGARGTVRDQVDALLARWSEARSLAPMGFLVKLEPFVAPDEHVYLIAEKDARVVGFLSAVPVYGTNGWLVEDLLRDRTAPNGTIELLVDHAMRAFAEQASGPVTLGLAPLAGDVPAGLRFVRCATRWLFDFRGLYAFKRKLRPAYWEPIDVVAAPSTPTWRAVVDGLAAFARGSFVRFGLATFARAPRIPLGLLTLALFVWTPLMWMAKTERWFPSRHVQTAWVVFDIFLAMGLVVLLRRYRAWLGVVLATAVTTDAVVTAGEALAFNARRTTSMIDAVVVFVACAGPILGAVTLWTTVRRRRILERSRALP